MDVLEDSLSNSVQMTEPRATLAENMTTGMEELMRMYVEPLKVARVRTKSGRAQIQAACGTEFERAGVWGLMRKRIAAAMYTRPGDPLRIDCGYRAEPAEQPRAASSGCFMRCRWTAMWKPPRGWHFPRRGCAKAWAGWKARSWN